MVHSVKEKRIKEGSKAWVHLEMKSESQEIEMSPVSEVEAAAQHTAA